MERSGEEGGGEGGQRRRRRQKGKKLKGGPGIESTCWVVVVGRIHGDRKPRLDPKEDVFRFEKKKTREEDRFDHRAKGRGRGGRVLSFPPPLKGKGWRNHLLGRGRVAFAYFSQFLTLFQASLIIRLPGFRCSFASLHRNSSSKRKIFFSSIRRRKEERKWKNGRFSRSLLPFLPSLLANHVGRMAAK